MMMGTPYQPRHVEQTTNVQKMFKGKANDERIGKRVRKTNKNSITVTNI